MTEHQVGPEDTAGALGSGDVDVLGTPRLLAWLEAATVAAQPRLGDGETTVGVEVRIRHRRPSAVGSLVRTHAEPGARDGARITFRVSATSEDGTVLADGEITRAVVVRADF